MSFNLEKYLSLYTGHSKIARCHHIAVNTLDEGLSRQAFTTCINLLKNTQNTDLYQDVLDKAQAKFGPDTFPIDVDWIGACEQRSKDSHARMEESLKKLKMAAIKENIRQANNELGALLVQEGDLQGAIRAYQQNKDYTGTTQHTIEFTGRMMVCAMDLGNWSSAVNSASKLRHLAKMTSTSSSSSSSSSSFSSSISSTPSATTNAWRAGAEATLGVVEMQRGNYRSAANLFLQTGVSLDSSEMFTDVVRLEDVALYGGLCCLATFERQELDDSVLRESNFREVLELYPKVREMIASFHESKYAAGFQCLSAFSESALLDIHLSKHYKKITNEIRNRVIQQYFRPYLSVSLQVMADALVTSVDDLENECARLINEDKLLARIDSHQKILKSKETDERTVTYQKVMATGDKFMKDMHIQLLSMSLTQHNFVHRTRGVSFSNKRGAGGGSRSSSSSSGFSGMSKQDGDFF